MASSKPSPRPPSHYLEKIRLLWAGSRAASYRRLSHNVKRVVCEYLANNPCLVCVKRFSVVFFNVSKLCWEAAIALEQSVACDDFSSYTLAGADRMFMCGSSTDNFYDRKGTKTRSTIDIGTGKEAFLIHLKSDRIRVDVLPLMILSREAPGLAYFEESVFVFGTGTRWKMLEVQMTTSRSYFTPCLWSRQAYLCQAGDPHIDVFDLERKVFLECIAMPLRCEKCNDSVAWVADGLLTIVSRSCTTRMDLRSRKQLEVQEHKETMVSPGSTPVVAEGFVYWVRRDERCVKVRLDQPNVLTVY